MSRVLDGLAAFRLRLLFRSCFVLLALAVVGLALYVLQGEKQRSVDSYQTNFAKTKEQVVARLRHPSGQLALLNPPRAGAPANPRRAVVLPFSTIDFDDQNKARNAVEMAGCLVRYPNSGSLCVAVGNNPWAGGYVYAAGTFASTPLVPHRIGDEFLDGAHRIRVTADVRGQAYRWIAPFETTSTRLPRAGEGVRGRFTGYDEIEGRDYTGARPVKEFRGWVWQEARCAGLGKFDPTDCARVAFFSLRLPIDALREALFQDAAPDWPPPDLDRFRVRVQVLPPGEGAPLFDSDAPGAIPPFSLGDLADLLLPGESITIDRVRGSGETLRFTGREPREDPPSWITRLVGKLPVATATAPLELTDEIATPTGPYRVVLRGDARSVNKALSAVAARVSGFVIGMLVAIGVAWFVIELRIIHRIALLTRRSTQLTKAGDAAAAGGFDLADLRGRDELGLLASCLDDLLRRVREDARRERIRAEQEKDLWHAVGHEIVSPLQSLLVLHGNADDPSHRYIQRMQQAVRILYGSASPSEAFESSTLKTQTIDLSEFLRHACANAGIADIDCRVPDGPVPVRADEYSLEDVLSHVLKNADRYRTPGTAITIRLDAGADAVRTSIHDVGPRIPEEWIGRIFEYGVTDARDAGPESHRGQGLFVARTYMAKMGGTVTAHNAEDGVVFVLTLQRA